MKLTLEGCSSIKISTLQKEIRKLVNKNYPESNYEELYEYTEEELRKFSVNNQTFEYTAIENQMGGHRWFFLCPKCKKRVSKLFLPPENYPGIEHKYLCKNCHNLKNRSAVMGQNKIYQKVIKPITRMKEIEKKLEKGYLASTKVDELLSEYEEIEEQMKSTPEYRLYLFRKKKGKDF